jgi:hypothetical protein
MNDPMCGSEKKIVTNSAFLRRKRIWDEKKREIPCIIV